MDNFLNEKTRMGNEYSPNRLESIFVDLLCTEHYFGLIIIENLTHQWQIRYADRLYIESKERLLVLMIS